MITNDEARARVQRGAAHLDVVRPGWADRIDVGTLTLHDPCGCIVGQLCQGMDFIAGEEALGITAYEGAVPRGLDLSRLEMDPGVERVLQFRPLQDAWIEAIADRRLSKPVEVQTASDAVGLSVLQPVAVHARG